MFGASGVISPKTTAENKEADMILAVCRFAAQKHADYRTSVFRLFFHSFLYKSKQGRLALTVLLLTKSSFPLPLCVSLARSLFLVQALFPLQYFFLPLAIYENVSSSPSLFESH